MNKPTKKQLRDLAAYMEENHYPMYSFIRGELRISAMYCMGEYITDCSKSLNSDHEWQVKSIFALILAESI